MSSATTNLTTAPSPPLGVTPRSVPTLEDLYQMTSEPDERVVIRNVDWSFYEQLADSIPEGWHIHVDYDGQDVELMSSGLTSKLTSRGRLRGLSVARKRDGGSGRVQRLVHRQDLVAYAASTAA
jgi:hypothetical protein